MDHALLAIVVSLQSALLDGRTRLADRRSPDRRRLAGDDGQATTEYALVLLAGALVALLVIAWATAGGGAARIADLFNAVIDRVIGEV